MASKTSSIFLFAEIIKLGKSVCDCEFVNAGKFIDYDREMDEDGWWWWYDVVWCGVVRHRKRIYKQTYTHINIMYLETTMNINLKHLAYNTDIWSFFIDVHTPLRFALVDTVFTEWGARQNEENKYE